MMLDVAALARKRVGHGVRELGERVGPRAVQPVAVGGFHQQHVGFADRGRVANERAQPLADIAREHELARRGPLPRAQLDDGRAEDVTRIAETGPHAGARGDVRVVGGGDELPERALGVPHGVERRVLLAGPGFCLPRPLGFLLVDARAVGEHHFQQIAGRGRGVSRPGSTSR